MFRDAERRSFGKVVGHPPDDTRAVRVSCYGQTDLPEDRMSEETNDLFEPPLMSEIGEAQSYLDINRRIARNTVALDYPGLCGITLPIGCNSLRPHGQKKGFLRLRSPQSGCSATLPEPLGDAHPRRAPRSQPAGVR
jgi:hypothetical protein